jgi:hypothetical protein
VAEVQSPNISFWILFDMLKLCAGDSRETDGYFERTDSSMWTTGASKHAVSEHRESPERSHLGAQGSTGHPLIRVRSIEGGFSTVIWHDLMCPDIKMWSRS